jgi:hypothetical protein
MNKNIVRWWKMTTYEAKCGKEFKTVNGLYTHEKKCKICLSSKTMTKDDVIKELLKKF